MDLKIIKLPEELQIDRNIIDYAIDRYKQCVYYLLDDGIYKKCHGNIDAFNYDRFQRIIRSTRIKGIAIDIIHDCLYYHTSEQVYIVNLRTNVKMSFFVSSKTILKMWLFSKEQFFLILIGEYFYQYLKQCIKHILFK